MRKAKPIARRALVLSQVVAVAQGASRGDALAWLKHEQLFHELSRYESALLTAGELTPEQRDRYARHIERLVPLLWVIGKIDRMPPLTGVSDPRVLQAAIVTPPAPAQAFIESASLRPRAEIRAEYGKVYDAHWEARDARIFQQTMPAGVDLNVAYHRHYGFNWAIGYCRQEWDAITTET